MSSKKDKIPKRSAAARKKDPRRYEQNTFDGSPVIRPGQNGQRRQDGTPLRTRPVRPGEGAGGPRTRRPYPQQYREPQYRPGESYRDGQPQYGERPYRPEQQYDGYGYPPPAREAYAPQPEIRYASEPSFFKKHPKLKKAMIRTFVFCILVIFVNLGFLYYRGQLWFNEPRKRDYPVRGAVIDSSLGEVDWKNMSTQTISFAYIRATRGTSYVDEQYAASRKAVKKTRLLAGYYHEFDFHSDGKQQAENFIETVGDQQGNLRPMVRIARYGVYYIHMKDREKVRENLKAFLDRLEEEYGRRPVVMCDKKCYEEYIKEDFPKYTLWLMGHFKEPDEEDTHWALWEFNPRVRSSGYENRKKYYALSVYRKGRDIEDFKKNFVM